MNFQMYFIKKHCYKTERGLNVNNNWKSLHYPCYTNVNILFWSYIFAKLIWNIKSHCDIISQFIITHP